jgi:hypothetical protein
MAPSLVSNQLRGLSTKLGLSHLVRRRAGAKLGPLELVLLRQEALRCLLQLLGGLGDGHAHGNDAPGHLVPVERAGLDLNPVAHPHLTCSAVGN